MVRASRNAPSSSRLLAALGIVFLAAGPGRADDQAVVTAVLDTGIDATHPAFTGRLVPGRDFVFPGDPDPDDEHGGSHGTHVTGLCLGADRTPQGAEAELAARLRALPLRVADAVGAVAATDFRRAVEHAVGSGARVLNASIAFEPAEAPLVRAAFLLLAERDVVVVVPAGNLGADLDAAATYPAAWDLPNVIVVAGYNVSTDALWAASGRGRTRAHLAAPSVLVAGPAIGGGTTCLSGTSHAAPQVAYAAALLRAAHPDWDAARVKAHLLATARRVASLEGRVACGGVLDVAAALGQGPAEDGGSTTPAERLAAARRSLERLPADHPNRRAATSARALSGFLRTNAGDCAVFREILAAELADDGALDLSRADVETLLAAVTLDPDVLWCTDRALVVHVADLARRAVQETRGGTPPRRGLVGALDTD